MEKGTIMGISSALQPAVAASLAKWHDMVARRDFSELAAIVHPDATFRSPVAFNEYKSAKVLTFVLSNAILAFENFEYLREFATSDGLNVALEFMAQIAGKEIHGADLIRMNEEGQIVEFDVLARPMNAVQALGEVMKERVGAALSKKT